MLDLSIFTWTCQYSPNFFVSFFVSFYVIQVHCFTYQTLIKYGTIRPVYKQHLPSIAFACKWLCRLYTSMCFIISPGHNAIIILCYSQSALLTLQIDFFTLHPINVNECLFSMKKSDFLLFICIVWYVTCGTIPVACILQSLWKAW